MFAASAPGTKTVKTNKDRCKLCGRDFASAEELSTHNRLEHSANAYSPAGVA